MLKQIDKANKNGTNPVSKRKAEAEVDLSKNGVAIAAKAMMINTNDYLLEVLRTVENINKEMIIDLEEHKAPYNTYLLYLQL